MTYSFHWQVEPNGMFCATDRDPRDHEWYSSLAPSAKCAPIEDWMRPYYPTALTVDSGRYPLNAWGVANGQFCVSIKFKDLIEKLEPGVHQFLPAELRYGNDVHPYFILKFGQAIDAIDLEQSKVRHHEVKVEGKQITYWTPLPGEALAIRSNKIVSRHLWQSKTLPDLKFMSDVLHDLLEANAAASGVVFQMHREI